jgi:excisionase family DNA binding protein
MAASEEQLLSLEDVAGRLQVSDQTVRRWIKSGKLPAYKPGLEWRIKPSDLEEFLQARSSPKGRRSSPLEPTLNGLLEEERREAIYGPWLEFANRYADRWQQRIETGNFDLGSVNEFIATATDLMDTLHELNAAEVQDLPEQPYSFGTPGAKTGAAIFRIADLIDPLFKAGTAKFESSELEQLRKTRDEVRRAQERSQERPA